jgi:tetratricopeptide (TPR) repeat protein
MNSRATATQPQSFFAAEKPLDAQLALQSSLAKENPPPFLFSAWADLLRLIERYSEAAIAYQYLLHTLKLSTASQLVILIRQLQCQVKIAQFDSVHAAVESFLASAAAVSKKVFVLDHLACLPIMSKCSDYLLEALHWIERALALNPKNPTLMGTKGGLLVELGRLQEAVPFLQECLTTSTANHDFGISTSYLALVAKRTGQSAEAEKLAHRVTRY